MWLAEQCGQSSGQSEGGVREAGLRQNKGLSKWMPRATEYLKITLQELSRSGIGSFIVQYGHEFQG